jgi:hypothetical protein
MTPQKSTPVPEPSGRKSWVKKTPIEIFLEQVSKQQQRVDEMREALAHEERELEKLQEARAVLEKK